MEWRLFWHNCARDLATHRLVLDLVHRRIMLHHGSSRKLIHVRTGDNFKITERRVEVEVVFEGLGVCGELLPHSLSHRVHKILVAVIGRTFALLPTKLQDKAARMTERLT